MRKNFENVNPNKLYDEFINAGVVILDNGFKKTGENTANAWYELKDNTDMILVQKIVDTHNPVPSITEEVIDEEKVAMAEAIVNLILEVENLKVQITGGTV